MNKQKGKDTSTKSSKKPSDVGQNRTGIAMSPIDSAKTIEGARDGVTTIKDSTVMDVRAFEAERLHWAAQSGPVGSMPPPGSLKGAIKTAIEAAEGHKATVFIDKLAERLAYERTGVRLYEALLVKVDAADVHPGGPTRAEVEHIRDDEHRHFMLVRDAIEHLGADPTAMTPCADIVGVTGLGWVQVLSDPRTTLTQCLDVMLLAELGDNDAWLLLAELADSLGFEDLSNQFRTAISEEQDHLVKVRRWVTTSVLGQAKGNTVPRQPQTPAR
jgi:rubrerythrin